MPAIASRVAIGNMALTHLNSGIQIASLTEATEEAAAINQVFDTSLDMILSSFWWPFATKQADLGLLTECPVGDEWAYEYAYPSDCIHARRILGLSRGHAVMHEGTGGKGRIPFKIAQRVEAASGADVRVILTDQRDAKLEYTKRETQADRYPPDFALALSYHIAALIVPRIAGAQQARRLRQESLELFQFHLSMAKARAGTEEATEITDESTFSRARDGAPREFPHERPT